MDRDERLVAYAWFQISERSIKDPLLKSIRDAVAGSYCGPGRYYHGLDHAVDCVRQAADEYLIGPLGIVALWYHDVVYVAGAKDNEEKSAEWFAGDARGVRVDEFRIGAISNLILATKHTGDPGDRLGRLVVDIDMSGLGASWEIFEKNDRNIRQEFIAFPDEAWRAGRKAFLQGLLAKERIFFSDEFRSAGFEERARANIARKIAEI